MVKVSKGKLIETQTQFIQLGQLSFDKHLAYQLGIFIRKANSQIRQIRIDVEAVKRRYGKASGTKYEYSDEDRPKAEAAIQAILDEELTFNIDPIAIDQIKDAKMMPNMIAVLDYLFEDIEDATPTPAA